MRKNQIKYCQADGPKLEGFRQRMKQNGKMEISKGRWIMTKLLEKAFKEASKLPVVDQNAIAKWLLEELESEKSGS